jgi:hypothetical protein
MDKVHKPITTKVKPYFALAKMYGFTHYFLRIIRYLDSGYFILIRAIYYDTGHFSPTVLGRMQ